ncbi:MAG: stage V sporulation protein AA, partial [Oscillospiraceae bacterium]|nr:stage V sporulation protein AA [Oscillospiraceae bacterium]
MIYLRVKQRVTAPTGTRLMLGDVADVLADARLRLHEMPVALPRGRGVWQVEALQLIVQIQGRAPNEVVNVLGSGIGWLQRERTAPRARMKGLRLSLLCAIPVAVGALFALYALLGGAPPVGVALPYGLGILLGAGLY